MLIRRSDDALTYMCETEDGRQVEGSVKSEVEGGKMTASVLLFDLGNTDAITDKHRRYQPDVIIQVSAIDDDDIKSQTDVMPESEVKTEMSKEEVKSEISKE